MILAGGCREQADDTASYTPVASDNPGLPIEGIGDDLLDRFLEGDAKFEASFRETQGLGPAYIRTACSSCHADDGRGAGVVQKMVLVDVDGTTPLADQSPLAWGHTVRPYVAGGATTPLGPPDGMTLLLTTRLPPPVMGRGYVDAVLDSEIERVAAEQASRGDGIQGHPNYVTYQSVADPENEFHTLAYGDPVIGRFGLKARIGTADDFSADAYQGDMSITTPFRPEELPNPDALTDDGFAGIDLDAETVERTADYLRLLEIPARAEHPEGSALFSQVGCDACHVPTLRTRPDYAVPAIADMDAPIYSDLLLHDMGPDFTDGLTELDAGPSEWKTPPLIGLRFQKLFLHDGRAQSVEEAIVAHGAAGSEAAGVVSEFEALSSSDRALLLEFVESL